MTLHPQGPLLYRVEAHRPARARGVAAVVFAACGTLLALSAWMKPDPRGLGTHQQLGFPPCTMVVLTGYPCPTCGMTTAFAHTVRGELISAFKAQPAGLILAVAVIVVAAVSLGVVLTGKVWKVNWYRVSPTLITVTVVGVLLGGWLYKVLAGIMTGTLPVGKW